MNQPAPLREQLKALEHLQELDLKIDQIKKSKTALPTALKSLDDQLKKMKIQLDLKNNAVTEVEKVQKQTRAALDLNKDRLTRSTARLEGVQNTQEFQAINKEIDQLNKLNGTLEEQLKKSALEMETLSKSKEEVKSLYDKIEADRNAQAETISGQDKQLTGDITALSSERNQYTVKVEKSTLALYDRVRGARAGIGIVPALGGRCKGCNMMVPPQLYNEIQKCLQLHSCPSCHRILFAPAAEAKAN